MALKKYTVRLKSIRYTGKKSIGTQFKITVRPTGGKPVTISKRLKFNPEKPQKVDIPIFEKTVNARGPQISLTLNINVEEVDKRTFEDTGKGLFVGRFSRSETEPVSFGTTVPVSGDRVGDKSRKVDVRLEFELVFTDVGDERPETPAETPEPKPPRIPPFNPEEIPKKGYPLIAVVSDLHMGIDPGVDEFDKEDEKQWGKMIDMLISISKSRNKKIELVILGDFFEFWETKPYFGKDAKKKDIIENAKGKVSRIWKGHKAVFAKLRAFLKARKGNKIIYVPGNHDDDIRSKKVQAHAIKVTGVAFDFRPGYIKIDLEVIMKHGHEFDDANLADELGEKIIGRRNTEIISTTLEQIAILQRIAGNVNYERITYPFEVIDDLPLDEVTQFGAYVRCLRRKGRLARIDAKKLEKLLDSLQPKILGGGIGGTLLDSLGLLIDLLRANPNAAEELEFKFKFADTASTIGDFFLKVLTLGILGFKRGPKVSDARQLMGTGDYRCVVFGHTHNQQVTPIGGGVYINSGAWQDISSFDPSSDNCLRERPNRHLTLIYRLAKSTKVDRNKDKTVNVEVFTFPGPQKIVDTTYEMRHPH